MLCEDCNSKDATMRMTKIINGKKEEKNLCDDCAKKNESFSFESDFSMPGLLASLLDGNIASNMNITYKQNKKCPQCGSTYNNFKRSGRLGCGMCYNTFNELLYPLVKRIQGSTVHNGKIPKKSGSTIRLRKNLNALKTKLHELIVKEEFEEAASIRDEIRKLEDEIDSI